MMTTNKIASRTFGIAFLIGYLSYGIGFGHLNTLFNAANDLLTIDNHKNLVLFEAAVLMAVFAPVNIVLGMVMTPIFKTYNQSLAYGYLSAAIASTVLLIVGAVFLLLLVPLSAEYAIAAPGEMKYFEIISMLCKKGNFYAYQIAMVIWGLGGLLFCYLMYISQLIPRWMAIWGFIGYVIFISGAFFALFGIAIDVILDIPGGLFEIFLSFRLIIKGFDFSRQKISE